MPTAMPILTCGAIPVIVDTKPDRLALDPSDVEVKLAPRTKAGLATTRTSCERRTPHRRAALKRTAPRVGVRHHGHPELLQPGPVRTDRRRGPPCGRVRWCWAGTGLDPLRLPAAIPPVDLHPVRH
nr:DegT/DnrJ/EryC1/StrS family aminotransferase [Micromonospora sp. NBRC 107566]